MYVEQSPPLERSDCLARVEQGCCLIRSCRKSCVFLVLEPNVPSSNPHSFSRRLILTQAPLPEKGDRRQSPYRDNVPMPITTGLRDANSISVARPGFPAVLEMKDTHCTTVLYFAQLILT